MNETLQKKTAGCLKLVGFLTKYAMVIALVVVFALFAFLTDGRLLYAQNMSNLMLQNGYVLVMACGMLLCILTGGNIDLAVGSVICLVGGLAATLISNNGDERHPGHPHLPGWWACWWACGRATGSAMSASRPSSPPWAACSSSAAWAVWCWTTRPWPSRIPPS